MLWFVNFDLDDEAAWGPVRDGIEALDRSPRTSLAWPAERHPADDRWSQLELWSDCQP